MGRGAARVRGFGRPALGKGWLVRLRALMGLAIGVFDRVPDSLDELIAVRRVRDLIGRVVPGEAGRVSVEGFNVLMAGLARFRARVPTPGDRARLVRLVNEAKGRTGYPVTWSDLRIIVNQQQSDRAQKMFDAKVVLDNGVVWIPDLAVPEGDAGLVAARRVAADLPADPDRASLHLYASGGRWDGIELWAEELQLLRIS